MIYVFFLIIIGSIFVCLPSVIATKRQVKDYIDVISLFSFISVSLLLCACIHGEDATMLIPFLLFLYVLIFGCSCFLPSNKNTQSVQNKIQAESSHILLTQLHYWYQKVGQKKYSQPLILIFCIALFFPFIYQNLKSTINFITHDPIGLGSAAFCLILITLPIAVILLYFLLKKLKPKNCDNTFSCADLLINLLSLSAIAISIDISLYLYLYEFPKLIISMHWYLLFLLAIACLQIFYTFIKFSPVACMLLLLAISATFVLQ